VISLQSEANCNTDLYSAIAQSAAAKAASFADFLEPRRGPRKVACRMIPDYSDIFNAFWLPSDRSVRRCQAAHNRDYRWSSTPGADRCAVFGIRLGQRPSEPLDLADRLRPAAILQLPDTRRA